MGIRPSTLKQAGKGTNRSNAYRARIIGGPDGVSTWDDLWVCQHLHDNRDNDANHAVSARTCAEWTMLWVLKELGESFSANANPLDVLTLVRQNPHASWGMFLLQDATEQQLDWLAERAEYIRTGKASNAGNRRAYPESWVTLDDGRRYRGKLWEKEDDSEGLLRRLFVAGPFGDDEYQEGHVDLADHSVHLRNGQTSGTMIHLGWQEAAKRLEWTIPSWAPKSHSVQKEFHDGRLHVPKGEPDDSLEVPAVYRVRVNREGGTRTYDIVEVQTGDVIEEGLARVPAYRRCAELNESHHQVNRRIKPPEEVWVDQFVYEAELWAKLASCTHCGQELVMESMVWLVDHQKGGGPAYCSRDCARKSLEQLDRKTIEEEYVKQDN